jgi:hypothetical protein
MQQHGIAMVRAVDSSNSLADSASDTTEGECAQCNNWSLLGVQMTAAASQQWQSWSEPSVLQNAN